MKLTIHNPDNLELDDFIITTVIPKLQEYFLITLDIFRLVPIAEYVDTLKLGTTDKTGSIDLHSQLVNAINHLTYIKYPDNSYVISIDSLEIAPGSCAKIIDIAKLVNNGTLTTAAYPIFDEVFDFYAPKIPSLYDTYRLTTGEE